MGFAQHKYQVEEDGCIAIGQEAGLGVEIDEAALQAMQWEPAQLRPWPKQID